MTSATEASCGGCARRWTGTSQCHCAWCCCHFSSSTAFDLHQVGGKCVDPISRRRRNGSPVFDSRTDTSGVTHLKLRPPAPSCARRSEPLLEAPMSGYGAVAGVYADRGWYPRPHRRGTHAARRVVAGTSSARVRHA